MQRWGALFGGALCLLLAAPGAFAAPREWMITVNGGAGIPVGKFASSDSAGADAGTGFQFGGDLDYFVNEKVAVGIDGGYNRNKHGIEGTTEDFGGGNSVSYDKDRFNTTHFGAHVKYLFPMNSPTARPFATLGVGVYSMTEDWEYTYKDPTGTTVVSGKEKMGSRPGGRVGGGVLFRAANAVHVGVSADYNFISMDKDKFGSSNASFFSIRGTLSYSILPK